MRDQASAPRVEHGIVRRKPLGDVIRRKNRRLGRRFQPVGAHHCDVHPRNRQNAGTAVRRRRNGSDCIRPSVEHAVPGEELCQVRADRDRPDAGTAATVRNAERLVQIQVRYVGPECAGRGQAHERIQVRSVDVYLAAMRMHDVADIADVLLEHAVGRGIGDHDRGEVFRMFFGLDAQITDVDVAARVAGDHHDLHAGHAGGGRIGAVRRRRDKTCLAMRLAARGVIGADRQ